MRVRSRSLEQRMQFLLRDRNIGSVRASGDLKCDGLLEPLGDNFSDGFSIVLNEKTNATRLRFTVAHEVCHTFFYEFVPELKFVPHGEDPQEERLCDIGAAELLMPPAPVRKAAKSMPVCFDSLSALATRFAVSLTAMFLRLRSLGLWTCEFSHWYKMINGTFVLDRFYGDKSEAWEWEDESILRLAWESMKGASGHTFVRFRDESGVMYYKPVRFELKRVGDKLFALWGRELERPVSTYPLLTSSCNR
jgi:hypothetical protein